MGLRIGSFLGGIVRTATNLLPGPVGAVARTVVNAVAPPNRLTTPGIAPYTGGTVNIPAFAQPSAGGFSFSPQQGGLVPTPGFGGTVSRFLPGGDSGYTTRACLTKDGRMRRIRRDGQCYKRPTMNPLNKRAAGRAITRLKSVRKILHSIEAAMPKVRIREGKKGKCGCR